MVGLSLAEKREMKASPHEREVLRRLAEQVARLATSPRQEAKRRAINAVNTLKSERPVVYCLPEGAWLECIAAENLVCRHPILRGWETRLRMMIYADEFFEDDQPVEAVFNIPFDAHFSGMIPVEVETTDEQEKRPYFLQANCPLTLNSHSGLGAFHWTPPLQEHADIEKLREPVLEHDAETSAIWLATAQELFGDVLSVRRRAYYWELLAGFPTTAVYFRGMEKIWMDLLTEPDWVRALLDKLFTYHNSSLDQLEQAGLLTLNNGAEWIGTGGLGITDELPRAEYDPENVRLRDLWGGLQAQDLVGISPEMFEEFFLPQCRSIMERFGLSHFGCCEPIHIWIESLKQVQNLRRVSVSPFSDVARCAEALGPKYVLSWKPLPADVCMERFDEKHIRGKAVEGLRHAAENGCHVEIIMKDLHTVCHEPERLRRWVRIQREAIAAVYGD